MSFRTGKGHLSKRVSRSARAGLCFPVGRLTRRLRTSVPHLRLSSTAPVYLSSVIEYLTVEILELAGGEAKSGKKRRIVPKHIQQAIKTDTELNALLGDVTLSQAGGYPHIAKELFNSTKNKKPVKSRRSSKVSLVDNSKRKRPILGKKPPEQRPKASGGKLPLLSEGTLFLGQKLSVLKGDISTVSAESIVHPTDSGYSTSGQVGKVLHTVGGPNYENALLELRAKGPLPGCGAAICDMYGIHAKKIIHCNCPSWSHTSGTADLEKTIQSCLKLADQEGMKSIALPSIGSGNAGWPKQLAAETILRAINRYFQGIMGSCIREVFFVLYDSESLHIYTMELKRLMDTLLS